MGRIPLLAAACLACAACDRGYGEGPMLGIVYGTVTGPSGAPVAGATLTLWKLDHATCSTRGPISGDSAVTTATGSFRIEDWSFGGGRRSYSVPTCAELAVRLPAGAALSDTSVGPINYRIYLGPPDSTRVDIALSP